MGGDDSDSSKGQMFEFRRILAIQTLRRWRAVSRLFSIIRSDYSITDFESVKCNARYANLL